MVITIIINGKKSIPRNEEDNPRNLIQNNTDGTQNIIEKTEIGEALEQLNDDKIDVSDTRMSGIDMRSRLHHAEISSVLALDALVALGICPSMSLAFTRQKKRLSVSLGGQGRDDIVNVVSGKQERENSIGRGIADKMKGMFGMGGQKQ